MMRVNLLSGILKWMRDIERDVGISFLKGTVLN